jgi:hypothetical protein
MEAIREYLKVLEIQDELVSLNEFELKNLISKLTPESKTKALIKDLSKSTNKRDPIKSLKRVSKLLKFLPTVELKKIDSYMKSKTTDYVKFKRMADVVVGNSLPGISDKARDFSSSFLAVTAFVVPKGKDIDPAKNLKNNIKTFVFKTRKFMDEQEDNVKKSGLQKEDLPDLAVAWVIVLMTTALAAGLGTGAYLVLAAIAKAIPTIIIIGIILVAAGGVIAIIETAMAGIVAAGG